LGCIFFCLGRLFSGVQVVSGSSAFTRQYRHIETMRNRTGDVAGYRERIGRHGQEAGPSATPLAVRLREASLRMTVFLVGLGKTGNGKNSCILRLRSGMAPEGDVCSIPPFVMRLRRMGHPQAYDEGFTVPGDAGALSMGCEPLIELKEGLEECPTFPQRLKPRRYHCVYGGTEVPPFQNRELKLALSKQGLKPRSFETARQRFFRRSSRRRLLRPPGRRRRIGRG
jgi:hypothetical protein